MDVQSRREALHALRLLHPHLDAAAAAAQLASIAPAAPLDMAAALGAPASLAREQAKASLAAQVTAARQPQFAAAFDALRARAPAVLDEMVEIASLALLRGPAILGGTGATSKGTSTPALASTSDILATLASASAVLR